MEVKAFASKIMNFYRTGSDGTLDHTIVKLKAIKDILGSEHDECTEFDDLIEMAKEGKNVIEGLNIEQKNEDINDSYEFDEDFPRYYWGGEDGNENIFYDDY